MRETLESPVCASYRGDEANAAAGTRLVAETPSLRVDHLSVEQGQQRYDMQQDG